MECERVGMHKNYLEENYLENIYMLSLEKEKVKHKDIMEKMKRAKSVVTKAIHILVEKRYLTYGEDKIVRLTDEGLHIAEKVYQKHVYLKELLLKVGIDTDNAVKKLNAKLEKLTKAQETMKAVNAYYRKHKNLEG